MESCLDIGCIVEFLNSYPFIISLITLPITFYGGWYLYRKQIDHDAIEVHFKDLKNHVITPILARIQIDKDLIDLSEPDANQKIEKMMNPGFSIILFHDLLENHYPEIKQNWTDVIKNLRLRQKQLEEKIDNLIKDELNKRKIRHRDQIVELKRGRWEPERVFVSQVRNVILDKNPSFEFRRKDGNRLPHIDSYAIVDVCYVGHYDTKTEKIFNSLKEISKNPEIITEVENFRGVSSRKSEPFIKLQDNLRIISNKTALKTEKKNLRIMCKFVKPKL